MIGLKPNGVQFPFESILVTLITIMPIALKVQTTPSSENDIYSVYFRQDTSFALGENGSVCAC